MKPIIDKATVLELAYKHAYACLSPEVEPDDYSFRENDVLEFAQSLLLLAAKACEDSLYKVDGTKSDVGVPCGALLWRISNGLTKG